MEKDLLLEIGVEELPSAYMTNVISKIENIAHEQLSEYRLKYQDISVFGTPRRLTLYVKGLAEKQQDSLIETRGPKKKIAFDQEGNPTKAGLGFASSQKMDIKDLEIREVSGVEHLFAVKKEIGKPAEKVLGEMLVKLINSISFPKSMRWGHFQTRFARPIRWLLAMLGQEIINMEIENISSSNITYGHRFLSTGPIKVTDVQNYFHQLREHYVILDQEERKQMISRQVADIGKKIQGTPMENAELLDEVTFLVEYPTAFYGRFSSEYLQIPAEVLTTSMIEHQRYFPIYNDQQQLLLGFIGVKNGTDESLNIVTMGNERVLKARLEDALFFWKEDTKKPLDEMVAGLENLLFHERLGSVMDKVNRLGKLGAFISKETSLSSEEKIMQAAHLCKADLVSNMVYEFPELQGIMGRYYALKSGIDSEVSEAILEHYMPRFSGDQIPVTSTGVVLSLAEKLDNLVGCFAIGIKPTGSQDPYALRRQAIGMVNIIMQTGININLEKVIGHAYDHFIDIKPDNDRETTISEVMDFILQRMKGMLLEDNINYDVIDAVLAVPSDNLTNIVDRVKALDSYKKSENFADLMVVYNRSYNLSKKWNKDTVDTAVLIDDSEIQLYDRFTDLKEKFYASINEGDYKAALDTLAGLRPQIDNFFESVMVMVDDERLKAVRLSLLKSIANTFQYIADIGMLIQ